MSEKETIVSLDEYAADLCINRQTARTHCASGKVEAYQEGRIWQIYKPYSFRDEVKKGSLLSLILSKVERIEKLLKEK